jgi:hypothetical protein
MKQTKQYSTQEENEVNEDKVLLDDNDQLSTTRDFDYSHVYYA